MLFQSAVLFEGIVRPSAHEVSRVTGEELKLFQSAVLFEGIVRPNLGVSLHWGVGLRVRPRRTAARPFWPLSISLRSASRPNTGGTPPQDNTFPAKRFSRF